MTKQILTVHPVTQIVPEGSFTGGLYVWKCRACSKTTPDVDHPAHQPHLCPLCGEVMDLTPIRRTHRGS